MKALKAGIVFLLISSFAFAKTIYISPNNDGVQDYLEIPLSIKDKRYIQGWSFVITDANHQIVRTIENKISLPSSVNAKSFFKQVVTPKRGVVIPETVIWNGNMDNGDLAPDGTYFYYITATDDNGNIGKSKEYEVVIDTLPPEVELQQPGDKIFGEGAKSAFRVRQTGSKEDLWTGVFKSADGKVVRTYTWKDSEPVEFSWKGTDDSDSQLADGVYSYEIRATDRAGNKSSDAIISNIIYSAEKPATNIYLASSRYFSPNTESSLKDVSFNLTIPVPEEKSGNKLVEWALNIEDKSGVVVRSFNHSKDGKNPPSKVVFDGLDDSGNKLKDGEYRASVTAKYLNGYVPTTIYSPYVVLDTEKPLARIKASETTFGAGAKDSVTFAISIAPSAGAPVEAWKGVIKTADGSQVVRTYEFGAYPPASVLWNGINDEGKISEKGQYVMELSATDLAGNLGGGTSVEAVTFDTTEAQLLLAMSDTAFSPNGNGVKDTITFSPVTQTKEIASYEFTIKGSDGNSVYTAKGNNSLPAKIVWDGKNDSKILCNDGIYSAQLSLVATNGSQASASTQNFELDTVAPKLVATIPWTDFSPDNDGAQDNIPVTIKECTSEKLWVAEVQNSKAQTVKKITWNGTSTGFTWDGSDESGNVAADGIYTILISSTDDAGNSFSTKLVNIALDSRETKAYLTTELEGISPNGDEVLDSQKFDITLTVPDNILTWEFNIRREDGTSVLRMSEKDSEKGELPSVIRWYGADNDGKVCEGTFTGTLDIVYKKGNKVNVVSSPFVCTATPPVLKVQTAPEYFSPDNDGTDDDLFIKLSCATKAKVRNWTFTIKDPKGKNFWVQSGKTQITERLIWDGLSNVQKDSKGLAERVQSAMDYPFEFTVNDNLGMTNTITGEIHVDVLVIRDGNVLKMAVPSIIFESDAANFQTVNAKLSDEQVKNNIKTLNRIADILKKFKDYKVQIVGHANRLTDNPDEETVDNLQMWGRALTPLSKERAEQICAYLIKKGVNKNNVTTDGKGGTLPVANPKDKDNNWKNRRVEFILQK